ncbi:MAG: sigma 54-interacting transcriptional regulator [Pirellulaceae bacterium]|nr:sigma 54-interacting transcriptional regulator [Pirellulaceae bacterium]
MNSDFKGGNSRQLGQLLDALGQPLAIVDRIGEIVFVNAPLCRLVGAQASELVGQGCSWQVAEDGAHSAIRTALAPPAGALDGRTVVRQLAVPVVFGSPQTGQAFIPLPDSEGAVHVVLVVLGNFEYLRRLLTTPAHTFAGSRTADQTLTEIRSRWKTLDGLTALVGSSPTVQLAMQRAQLAVAQPCNLLIYGPAGVGKLEIAQAIFRGRLKSSGLHAALGQCFPIECRVLDGQLIASMLEIFVERLQSEVPRTAQQLVLIGLDQLESAAVQLLRTWIDDHRDKCYIVATSSQSAAALAPRSSGWAELVTRIATLEIGLSPLAERRQDIAPLALQSLAEACLQADRAQLTLSAQAQDLLVAYAWPNNVRQLRAALAQAVERAVLTASVQPSHLPVAIRTFAGAVAASQKAAVAPVDLDAVLIEVEKIMLRKALQVSPRNRARAARLLGISRSRLLRRIDQLGLGDAQQPAE